MNPRRIFVIIIALVIIAIYIDLPDTFPINLKPIGVNYQTTIIRPPLQFKLGSFQFKRDFVVKQGLDLQGGTHVVLEADMSKIAEADRITALDSAKNVIQRRVDLFGVSEPVIQTSIANNQYRIIVELPGIKDVNQALDLIGRTAQLDFRELSPTATEAATIFDFQPTNLTGQHLTRAGVQFDQKGLPEVSLQFDGEGAKIFADITKKNLNKPVAIFLDQYPVTIPTVQSEITSGQAVITGQFTLDQAKNLAIQLNAGALPVPIQIIEQRNVGASLGQESVQKSLQAGLIGLGMVMLFMIFYYGWLGFLADIALVIYALLTFAVYKLIPVTLSLPGLTGFILSVGMAVDSNILIFERMKEERRWGKPWRSAMELGFGRAWDSIKDANVATLITAFILFNPFDWPFLNSSGLVRGFALTLSLGIGISLFTGIVVSRTLIRVFYRYPTLKKEIAHAH
jgi:preprotein translocase subunit SecD